MEQRIIIGYQGTENSNNHLAAKKLMEKLGLNAELRALITGANVVAALRNGEIRYGVYAYSTDCAGLVQQNVVATKDTALEILADVDIDIHHQFYKKNDTVPNEAITAVASHPEALRECIKTVKGLYPNIEIIEAANTGVAARQLAEGELPETTAVICNKKLGEQYHFAFIKENAEDLEHNGTKFVLVQLKQNAV